MVPAWVVAGLYFAASLLAIVTSRFDVSWISAARLFLAAVLAAWGGFYLLVMFDLATLDVLRVLSRWLHLPTIAAVTIMVVARWYHDRQWGHSE